MYIDLKVKGISRTLYIHKIREIDQTTLIKEFVKPGMYCLDLGANIGYYTLLFSSLVGKSGKVFAVEPDSRNLPLLKKNIELNGISEIVNLFPVGVGSEDSKTYFFQSEYSNLSKLDFSGNKKSEIIDVLSLNSLGKIIGNVNVIRMDIEGAELLVISNNSLIYLSKLEMGTRIFVEVHPNNYLENNDEFSFEKTVEILGKAGFNSLSVISSGASYSKVFTDLNYVPSRSFIENKWERFQFDNIRVDDLISLCTKIPKVVRYAIFTKSILKTSLDTQVASH
jgi:FkbM family methyltransferase